MFLLQTIQAYNETFNLFYDSGCGALLSRFLAILRLKQHAIQLAAGNFKMKGVGDSQANANHGIYGISLPLADGGYACMEGACMDVNTERFPHYPLKGEIEEDIHKSYLAEGGKVSKLPVLPDSIGGDTDIMMGSKYRKFFPKEIFRLPSGLSICQSLFKNPDGTRGVICGPHPIICKIDQQYGHHTRSFLESQRKLFQLGYHVNPDVPLLGFKDDYGNATTDEEEVDGEVIRVYHAPRSLKKFQEVELAGSEITYKCPDCRVCKKCKYHEHIEATSIKEEVEQNDVIKSVNVDTEKQEATASLPLLGDPAIKLAPNSQKALKTYNQQLKILNRNPEDKKAFIESEQKLQLLGHVAWV